MIASLVGVFSKWNEAYLIMWS